MGAELSDRLLHYTIVENHSHDSDYFAVSTAIDIGFYKQYKDIKYN